MTIISFVSENKLKENKIHYESIVYYDFPGEEIDDFNEKWLNYLNDFSSKEFNKTTFFEHFSFDNKKLQLWIYHKFRIYHELKLTFFQLKKIEELLKCHDKITVISNQNILKLLNDNRVDFIFVDKEKHNKFLHKKLINIIKYSFVFFVRVLISRKKIKKSLVLHGNISSEIKVPSISNFEKKVKINSVWGYLAEKYNDSFGFIEDIQFPKLEVKFKVKWRFFSKKYFNTITSEYIIYKSFTKKSIKKSINNDSIKLSALLDYLEKNIDCNVDRIIIGYLKNINKTSLLYIRKYYAYKYFFNKNSNVKAILSYGENLSQSKPILDAAKSSNVYTYGLQHGVIGKYNIAYNFSKYESLKEPYPHKTFVWGEIWKNDLLNYGAYNKKSIIIVGQPRTDIISHYKSYIETKPNRFVFFSQPQPDKEERYLAAKTLIKVIKNYLDLELIIKLHPAENDDIYSDLIKKHSATNVSVETRLDTYSLISSSEIGITCYSTVGMEILLFGKKLIVFDSKEKDLAGYLKNNIAYHAKNEYDLKEIIENYLQNNLPKLKVDQYLSSINYCLDGKTNERIYEHIKKHL